jgi:hypothetical protein
MTQYSECRIGFALKYATPIIGDDAMSWACEVTTGDFLHNGKRVPHIVEALLVDARPVYDRSFALPPEKMKYRSVSALTLFLDLLTGDVHCGKEKRRGGAPMVNLREWAKQRKQARMELAVCEEVFEFFPVFCAKHLTAYTSLFPSDYDAIKVTETRCFRDFANNFSNYKQNFTSEISSLQPKGVFSNPLTLFSLL